MNNLPTTIPIFPLSGVIYFPRTNLPLNIFEQRYLDLVNDAYNNNKFMGMIQSRKDNNAVYDVGCLGKISDYQKSKDGRILINGKFSITLTMSLCASLPIVKDLCIYSLLALISFNIG